MIEHNYIVHGKSRLHYVHAGGGKEAMLFFHGFGQDHSVYLPLIQSLTPQYDLYIFDLYFHGKSVWGNDEKPVTKNIWKETLDIFLQTKEITQFSVVGFSMGGKFALATLELFPTRVRSCFLIAPDGVKTSFWYNMATYPVMLRKFFKGMINDYHRFQRLAVVLNKLKLVDQGLIRFADYQMGTEQKRKRVYYSWVVFRLLRFSMKNISALIRANNIRLTVITGKYDKVIKPKNMQALLRYVPEADFYILEAGHSGLIYESLSYLKNKLPGTQVNFKNSLRKQ
ncbi:MAG TPA: alpha/beta hydrolase [Chryseosolibacter sp.]|nr:alpha/beta hydrolase [Chryseosolibacter sp.]